MCTLSPMVFLAAMVGITVSSLTGSAAAGWAAGAAVAAVVYLVTRRRSMGGGACGLPHQTGRPFEGLDTGAGSSTHGGIVVKSDEAVRQP